MMSMNAVEVSPNPEILGLEAVRASNPRIRRKGLIDVQEQLKTFSDGQSEIFQQHISSNLPDLYQSQVRRAEAKWMGWLEWLTFGETEAEQGLEEILGWHVGAMERLQASPTTDQVISGAKTTFRRVVLAGLRGKWLHEQAETSLDGVEAAPVLISDGFSSRFSDKWVQGVYSPKSGQSFVRADLGLGSPDGSPRLASNTPEITIHELAHKLISTGLRHDTACDLLGRIMFFEEPSAQHFTQVALHGHPDVLSPFRRPNDSQVYSALRQAHALAQMGHRGKSPTSLMMRAYSGGLSEKQEFLDRHDYNWGELGFLMGLYNGAQAYAEQLEANGPNLSKSERNDRAATNMIGVIDNKRSTLFSS